MKGFAKAILAILFLVFTQAHGSLADRTFFEAISGSWVGDGSLTNADGDLIPIHEEWTGSVLEDGSFEMKGDRNWGDDLQEFRWHFIENPVLELIECEYWHTGMDSPLRFEVSLTESEVELKAPFGDPGGELKITNVLSEQGMDGSVSATQSSGVEVLSGTVIHQRQEEAE